MLLRLVMNRMKTSFERVTHHLTVAIRRLVGGEPDPHTAERELRETVARHQTESPKASQKRAEGRWEDEGGAVTRPGRGLPERR